MKTIYGKAVLASQQLWHDPYLAADQTATKLHHSIDVVGSVENSCDGSGAWTAVHLLDANGRFIQGGWLPSERLILQTIHQKEKAVAA